MEGSEVNEGFLGISFGSSCKGAAPEVTRDRAGSFITLQEG